jgi:hypothetical protein
VFDYRWNLFQIFVLFAGILYISSDRISPQESRGIEIALLSLFVCLVFLTISAIVYVSNTGIVQQRNQKVEKPLESDGFPFNPQAKMTIIPLDLGQQNWTNPYLDKKS